MASTQVLLLSIPRAETENPKPRIVHYWGKANEGVVASGAPFASKPVSDYHFSQTVQQRTP